MRKLLVSAVLLGASLSAHSQSSPTAPAARGWARVLALQPNTILHIKARTHNATCKLTSADADTLICLSNGSQQNFQRTEIKSIKISHRAQSAVAGLAIGAGTGAIIGLALGKSGGIIGRGGLAGIFAAPLGVLGAILGAATDFTHSTVYRQ